MRPNKIFKNKSLLFILVLILTILIARFLVYIFDPDIVIKGLELHHIYYGVVLFLLTYILSLVYKKKSLTYLILFAVSIGLIIDELEYILRNFQTIGEYTSTIPSVIILALIVSIIILINTKFKRHNIRKE